MWSCMGVRPAPMQFQIPSMFLSKLQYFRTKFKRCHCTAQNAATPPPLYTYFTRNNISSRDGLFPALFIPLSSAVQQYYGYISGTYNLGRRELIVKWWVMNSWTLGWSINQTQIQDRHTRRTKQQPTQQHSNNVRRTSDATLRPLGRVVTCVSGQLSTYDGNSFAVGTLARCKADMPRLDPLPPNHGFAKSDATGGILGLSTPPPCLRLLLLASAAFLAGNIIRGGSTCQLLATDIAVSCIKWCPVKWPVNYNSGSNQSMLSRRATEGRGPTQY